MKTAKQQSPILKACGTVNVGNLPPLPPDRFEELKQLFLHISQQSQQSHYSVNEFAKLVELAPWTVRRYLELTRIVGFKSQTGAGPHNRWTIEHRELERYRKYGLLPPHHRDDDFTCGQPAKLRKPKPAPKPGAVALPIPGP